MGGLSAALPAAMHASDHMFCSSYQLLAVITALLFLVRTTHAPACAHD